MIQNAEQWEIPRYWHAETKVDEPNLVENLQAHRIGHVDPILVIITDTTVTGGDMKYSGLSLAEALVGVTYPVESAPGESGNSPIYVVGDILGNASVPTSGAVVSRLFTQDGQPWYNMYLDTVKHRNRWAIEKFYNGDMRFPENELERNGFRRAAHADPHTVVVNDTMTNTGDMGGTASRSPRSSPGRSTMSNSGRTRPEWRCSPATWSETYSATTPRPLGTWLPTWPSPHPDTRSIPPTRW